MPRRSRRQCRLRPAEHGGTCPQEDERAKGLKGKEAPPYIEEEQDCKLATEHCNAEEVNPLWKDQFKVSGGAGAEAGAGAGANNMFSSGQLLTTLAMIHLW